MAIGKPGSTPPTNQTPSPAPTRAPVRATGAPSTQSQPPAPQQHVPPQRQLPPAQGIDDLFGEGKLGIAGRAPNQHLADARHVIASGPQLQNETEIMETVLTRMLIGKSMEFSSLVRAKVKELMDLIRKFVNEAAAELSKELGQQVTPPLLDTSMLTTSCVNFLEYLWEQHNRKDLTKIRLDALTTTETFQEKLSKLAADIVTERYAILAIVAGIKADISETLGK